MRLAQNIENRIPCPENERVITSTDSDLFVCLFYFSSLPHACHRPFHWLYKSGSSIQNIRILFQQGNQDWCLDEDKLHVAMGCQSCWRKFSGPVVKLQKVVGYFSHRHGFVCHSRLTNVVKTTKKQLQTIRFLWLLPPAAFSLTWNTDKLGVIRMFYEVLRELWHSFLWLPLTFAGSYHMILNRDYPRPRFQVWLYLGQTVYSQEPPTPPPQFLSVTTSFKENNPGFPWHQTTAPRLPIFQFHPICKTGLLISINNGSHEPHFEYPRKTEQCPPYFHNLGIKMPRLLQTVILWMVKMWKCFAGPKMRF